MSNDTPTEQPPAAVLLPSTSAFDFLEGSFARSERNRLTGLVLIGTAAVTLAGSLLVGAMHSTELSSREAELATASAELRSFTQELTTLDAAEGFSSAQLSSHVASRTSALQAAVGQELATVRLIRDVNSSAPSGVSVSAVSITDADPVGQVTVKARAGSFAVIEQWKAALEALPGLGQVDVDWSGGGASIEVNVTATLDEQALSERAQEHSGPAGPEHTPELPDGPSGPQGALEPTGGSN